MPYFATGTDATQKRVLFSNSGTISSVELLGTLRSLGTKQGVTLVGIDGCGGSGKSTLARSIAGAGAPDEVALVHMDDFYEPSTQQPLGENKPIGSNFDWERMLEQVLKPLKIGKVAHYQRYDWNSDSLAEWHDVAPKGIVIIEGVYSTRDELREFYDLRVFVHCPRDLRLKRGLERDGETARDKWTGLWMPAEDIYMSQHQPWKHAALLIDGSTCAGTETFRVVSEDELAWRD